MDDLQKLAHRLKHRNITAVSKDTGISRNYLYMIKNGKTTSVTLKTYNAIKKCLDENA